MIKRRHIIVVLLVVLGLVSVIARNSTEALFFIGSAVEISLALLIIVLLTQDKTQTLAEGLFLLSVGNVLDEVFFDPFTLGWNELAFAGLVVGWTLYRLSRGLDDERAI